MRTESAAPPPPTQRRRLYRRTDDKVIAGVASGLGDYFRADPVLFRIGFIALAFAGGAGIVLYGVAWLVMPPSHGGPSPGEEAIRRAGAGTHRLRAWIAVVLLVIGVGLLVNELGVHRPDLIWGGILVALGVLLFHHATTREEDEAPAPSMEPDAPPGSLPPAPIVSPGAASPPPPPPPGADVATTAPLPSVRRVRQRSQLGWATIGALFLAIGVAVLLDNTNAVSISLSQYFALAVLALALGLVAGAWIGRARWLVIPAVLLLPGMVMSGLVNVPLEGGFGDRVYRPVSAFDVQPYRLIAGRMTLDLAQMRTLGRGTTVTASVVAGEMHVVVPSGVTVVVDARVGAGELHLFGRWSNGLKLEQHVTRVRTGPDLLRLDLAVSFGQIFVRGR